MCKKFYFLFTFLIKKENFIKTSTLIQHPFERTHMWLPCIHEWLQKTGQSLQTHYLTFWNVSYISLVKETCSFEIFWSMSTWPTMIGDLFLTHAGSSKNQFLGCKLSTSQFCLKGQNFLLLGMWENFYSSTVGVN